MLLLHLTAEEEGWYNKMKKEIVNIKASDTSSYTNQFFELVRYVRKRIINFSVWYGLATWEYHFFFPIL